MGTTYDQLGMDEHCEIYRLHADGKSRRAIARSLGRAPSTICRELVRNSGAKVGYKVEWAEIQARARRCRRLYKLQCSSTLRDLVLDGLAMGWSPEQIAGRLERENGRPVISHESIYRYVYWRVATHRDYLHPLLPRAKFQHSLLAMLATFPAQQRRTIAFDNGSEFSEHHRLTTQLGMPTYFCDPHSPWQKGGIENAIGRLRRPLPRKTDLATLDPCRLDDLILDFRTPLEVFLGQEISLGVALEM